MDNINRFPHYYVLVDHDLTTRAGAGGRSASQIAASNSPTTHHRVTAYASIRDDRTYEVKVTGTPDAGGVSYGGMRGRKPQPKHTPWTVTCYVLPGMKRSKVDPDLNSLVAPATSVKKTSTGISCQAELVRCTVGGKEIAFSNTDRWPLEDEARLIFDIVS